MDDGTEENDTTERLPRTLHEAVKYFKEDEFLQEALGKHISHHLIVTKDAEWDEYCKQVTKWEIRALSWNRLRMHHYSR